MKTRVSSKGQVVIPKAYRQKLGWGPGTELVVEEEGGQVLLKPKPKIRKTKSIREVAGMLHRPNMKAITLEEMDRGIEQAIKEKWGDGRR